MTHWPETGACFRPVCHGLKADQWKWQATWPAAWWVEEGGVGIEREFAIFPQTAAGNVAHRRLWVLKISILPINYPKWGISTSQLLYFGRKFFDMEIFRGRQLPPRLMPRRHCSGQV